jgi:hypothetical protein
MCFLQFDVVFLNYLIFHHLLSSSYTPEKAILDQIFCIRILSTRSQQMDFTSGPLRYCINESVESVD